MQTRKLLRLLTLVIVVLMAATGCVPQTVAPETTEAPTQAAATEPARISLRPINAACDSIIGKPYVLPVNKVEPSATDGSKLAVKADILIQM